MDRERAEAMLTEASAELKTAESAVSYLRQVVSGLEGLLRSAPAAAPVFSAPVVLPALPDVTPLAPTLGNDEPDKSYPRTPDAILQVLQSRPNFPMSFKVIWNEMVARDLIDPSIKSGRNAYGVSARRLADNPKSAVIRDESDRYVYRTDSPEAAPVGRSLALARSGEGAPESWEAYTS